MKKEDIPQDENAHDNSTKEICYALDNSGKYTTALSTGWEVKTNALHIAWKDIEEKVTAARQKVLNKEASPLLFFMEYRMMNIGLVADYTGFWKWQIKRHLKPTVFNQLPDNKLKRYAEAFNVTVENLKTMTIHEA